MKTVTKTENSVLLIKRRYWL